ncbi:hypothetical protein FIV42_05115 [Persicimonas caeni]|uniref:Carbohydrate-binding domain-containing protein n=1 Tax=Persicimonas caeni TaxID=2292766 RepID=A0A4Y6PQT4_PERCE|nr:sugar-binding protein [Persicimonas caeni]QDG50135.1 hypothetical protein FIV42_05115 [Persicimonas caeni]QED31356.1 hypothetical protein FRD00_05110 [Persicimonas caeni]
MKRSNAVVLALLVLAAAASACSTSNTKGIDPFAAADEEEPADMLDAPVERRTTAPRTAGAATANEAVLMLPDPPAEKSKKIDAEVDDWSRSKARKFGQKEHVVEGEQFWTGGPDASFRVGVDSDAGHVYFWVDVRDDKVIDAASEDVMADGVILWLRDPKLEEIVDSLPAGMAEKSNVRPEMAILFTPDGQFWRYDQTGGKLYRTGIDAKTKKMKNGYRLEAALSLGVLQQVASLPTESIAFRVEVMDGDETDRRGEQTRMSMLPDESGPRFALYNVGGWLPYEEAQGQPPRPGALGRWQLADGTWRFQSFEVRPVHWHVLQDVSGFDKALANSEALNELCPAATSERTLVEGYQSRSGNHRAGLVYCGPRAPRGRCPDDAESHLYWVHLKPGKQGWKLHQYTEVTEKPLPQCATAPRKGGDYYSEFSLLPMEMLGSSVWGIGFKKTYSSSTEELEERGIWFANPSSKEPYMGKALNERTQATSSERTISRSHVYLALVDDKKGLDLCEVEHVKEQSCNGLNRSCKTLEHGEMVRTHIKMWAPSKGRFEPYLLTKHKRCNASFDFSQRRGFMLINEAGRLGALASPAN